MVSQHFDRASSPPSSIHNKKHCLPPSARLPRRRNNNHTDLCSRHPFPLDPVHFAQHGSSSSSFPPTTTNPPTDEEIAHAHSVLFTQGLQMRYAVAGKSYVDASLATAARNPFSQAMQEYVTEACWGSVWSRPGLERKTRSFLNIAMLCNQNRGQELATHVKGALNNGATEAEIAEVILQAACYCGMPAGIEGFRVAGKAIEEWKAEREREAGRNTEDVDVDVGLAERVRGDE